MTPAEEGAYIRLLGYAWNDPDCSLPNNDDELAALSRLGKGWFKGSARVVKACFKESGGRLYNDRLLKEREKQKQWREKCKKGGKASAKARKSKGLQNGKGSSRVVEPEGNTSFSSSSSNKYMSVFEEFWGLYPQSRRVAKSKCRSWWMLNAVKNSSQILAALKAQLDVGRFKIEEKFIPLAYTWLEDGRWEDDIPAKKDIRMCDECGKMYDGAQLTECPRCHK